ncbi:ScyD/ScyE family protein [Adhaeribacter radiodurans]|uniref:ScyD/ScyE family protein n=1 Tax=Adhaeribacter radiodurans TaxID=2745197 RepID=A0A7L7LD09_9BACT|nr:ScyD/ScyE family protein [Adhaeribacter radiodurans]QMU30736.1 ScyD/ScyE family protein [Adhaeribacter radiodurans]
MHHKITCLFLLILLISTTGCEEFYDIVDELKPKPPKSKAFATGLTAPLGVESDALGQLWVTEAGTGQTNDGQLSFITPQGEVYPVVQGFTSEASPEGAIFGLNHLLLKDNVLYMLHGVEGKLYKLNISAYQPGDKPRKAADLEVEDIGSFVKDYFKTEETDIFNLTVGPEGDIYIVDAAANAVIRRDAKSGKLSVFATIPPIEIPDGEDLQAVPTGIVFDGEKFLVCTFTGYPYPAKKATIYQIDLAGNTTVYQSGLSILTDIELGVDQKPVVLEYGTWTGESFIPNSGRMVFSTPNKNIPLLSKLNFPNSIERFGSKTFFIAQTFDGEIKKVTF